MDDVTLERQITEYECLKLFNSIVPGSVPEPYCLDINTHISKNLKLDIQIKEILQLGF